MCIPKMSDKKNLSVATGKWVLEKGQFTHVSGEMRIKMARSEGSASGKWQWREVSDLLDSGFRMLALCARGEGEYALAAQALPLQLALRARGSGFTLAARATRLRLGLCPRISCYALAARLGLRPRGSRYALAAWASRHIPVLS